MRLLAPAFVFLLVASSAHASTAGVQGSTLSVTAAAGETNRISISVGTTTIRVADTGATPRAGSGCTLADRTVSCPRAGLTEYVVDLGDRNDRIAVSRSVDVRGRIRGGTGDDLLSGGGGAEELDGGTGRDRVTYESRPEAVTVSLNGAADDGRPGEGDNVIAETVTGSPGFDVLVGGGGSDRLEGVAGDDRLDGGGGNDVLVGGSGADAQFGGDGNDVFVANRGPDGADVFQGGAGTDRADYSLRQSGVVADADGRADDGQRPGGPLAFTGPVPSLGSLASPEGDLVQPDVETLRGGAFEDVLGATPSGGRLEGLGGTDVLVGAAGTDTFDGGTGFDRVLARDARADTIACGSETDRVFADASDAPRPDCEQVFRSFAVSLAPLARSLTADGFLPVRVACPAQASVRCVGAVRAVTVRRFRTAAGRQRERTLGAVRFNVPAGGLLEVQLFVPAEGRTFLEDVGGATRVRLAARGRDEAGSARPAAARLILRGG